MNEKLEKRFEEIEDLALQMGLDPFPIIFEEVPRERIWDVASYGLPTRMSHWSFGRSYIHQKTYGEMGFGKIYELIINNNPSHAFLDDANPDVVNMLVAAHCYVPGTYVQTKSGLVTIENVRAGDKVRNFRGEWTPVEAPTARPYDGRVIAIQAGGAWTCQTPDHALYAVIPSPNDRTKNRSWKKTFQTNAYKPEWVEASMLSPGCFLVVNKPTGVGMGKITSVDIPIEKILWRRQVNETKQVLLDYDFGCLVGLFLAEGYAREKGQMGLCFHADETRLHVLSRKLIRKYLGLTTKVEITGNSAVVLFNEICIANFFRQNFGTKCHNKGIATSFYEDAPQEFLRGVLTGYLWGDGTLCYARSMGYSSTSPVLAWQIQQIAMLFGIYFGLDSADGSTEEQKRKISFVGSASGTHDLAVRSLLGLKARKLGRTWSGAIDAGDKFFIKIQDVMVKEYRGTVHCLKIPVGESFSLINGIVTHNCYGHSDFFKNNGCFSRTNRSMATQAGQNARIIDQYKDKYGVDEVEDWMDIAFSIERHIDPLLGENRPKYPDPEYEYKEIKPDKYADLFGEDDRPRIVKRLKNDRFPPHKERDLLWFIFNYGKMQPWQREILRIIRSESFYFYPQQQTKIMNEGWASFWHAEIMLNYSLTADEYVEFARSHAGVISPGSGSTFNPYYVGFRIWTDLKKRWDEYYEAGLKDRAFQRSDAVDFFDEKGKVVMSKVTGWEKIFKVRREDDDVSFVHNYLTRDLADDMKLFTFGYRGATADPDKDDIILKERGMDPVLEAITGRLHNYGVPLIWVDQVQEDGSLRLIHSETEMPLDNDYAIETLRYLQRAWGRTVEIQTHDRFGKSLQYQCDGESITKEIDGDKTIRTRI